MAYFRFTKAILEKRPIDVYNYGNMSRDLAYVDDIVEGGNMGDGKSPGARSGGGQATTPIPARAMRPIKLQYWQQSACGAP